MRCCDDDDYTVRIKNTEMMMRVLYKKRSEMRRRGMNCKISINQIASAQVPIDWQEQGMTRESVHRQAVLGQREEGDCREGK